MMAKSRAESTRDTYNYGQYINQPPPPNTIKVIREFERIQKKICRHKMSIMFNEICINEEMLPKYTYLYLYTYFVLFHTEYSILESINNNDNNTAILRLLQDQVKGGGVNIYSPLVMCCVLVSLFHGTKIIRSVLVDVWSLIPYSLSVKWKGEVVSYCSRLIFGVS